MSQFRIQSIAMTNYYASDPLKLEGNATVVHMGTAMEMKVKLQPEDCIKFFAILADRIGAQMQEVSQNVHNDVMQALEEQIASVTNKQIEASVAQQPPDPEPEQPKIDTDDIPF